MTRFERAYETAVLKTLGATSGHVVAMLAAEFALLGLAAGVVGASGATGLSWAFGRFVLDLPWRAEVTTLVAGVAAAVLLVAVVGVAASLDVIRQKPIATLRAE
jgi:putative ABC transport system permease protein